MGDHQQRLLVAIVNYKTPELVCNLLDSLIPQLDESQDQVCLVDNDSKDHSLNTIAQHIDKKGYRHYVKLIAAPKNGGFSYGNNLAIRSVGTDIPEYVLLLNPDTNVLVNSIAALLDFMVQRPDVGIAGARVEGEDGQVQGSAFRFHTISSEFENGLRFGLVSQLLAKKRVPMALGKSAMKVDWVSGACMLIRREVLKDIGLMDEDYFLYFEETDFCLQANRQGWPCWYVPDSRVIHYVGQSTGVVSGDVERRRRPQYWFQSRQRYFLKNHGVFYTLMTDFVWGSTFALWRLRRRVQKKPDLDPEKMLLDFWKNSLFITLFKR